MLICTYMVHFEWDERKNRSNLDKHGIDFETAQWIFEDPLCVTFVERTEDDDDEERFTPTAKWEMTRSFA